jgi:tetratricopeptide (TPR) repeat protein
MAGTGAEYLRGNRNRLLILAVFLLSAALLSGQAETAEETLGIQFTPSKIKRGQKFTLTLILDYIDPDTLIIEEPEFPEIVEKLSGPYLRPFVDTDDLGSRRRKIEVSYTFRGIESGRRVMRSFKIHMGDKTVLTEPRIIEIAIKSDITKVPYDVIWRASAVDIYEGQTVSLILELENTKEIVFPESVKIRTPEGVLMEEAEGLGEIFSESVGDEELYRIPVASYLLTATAPGSLELQSAQVTALDLTAVSNNLMFEVKELPERLKGSGAVGRFSYSFSLSEENIVVGAPVELRIRIEGVGNLNYLEFPEISAEGLIQSGKEQVNEFLPVSEGYKGFRELIYRYAPQDAGTYVIQVPSLNWLDLGTGLVQEERGRQYTLVVRDISQVEKEREEELNALFPLLGVEELQSYEAHRYFNEPLHYLWFAPGILFLCVMVFRIKRKKVLAIGAASLIILIAAAVSNPFPIEELKNGHSAFEQGEYQTAADYFETASHKAPNNAGILYNLGIVNYNLEKYGAAISNIRRAIVLKPMKVELRETLYWFESSLNLKRQIADQYRFHPDIAFFTLVGFFNVSAVFLAFYLSKKRGLYIILMILSVVLCIASVGMTLYSIGKLSGNTGVVVQSEARLRKIPDAEAAEWLTLKEGTSVNIIIQSGGYQLVRTGYGVEGWVETNLIVVDIP